MSVDTSHLSGSAESPEARSQTLVDVYYMRLYRFAYRLCANVETAKDLAFCTLEKALVAKANEFANEQAYYAWLCRILTNLHRDNQRLKAANALDFVEVLPEIPDERQNPALELELAERRELVKTCVQKLPIPLREVVVLYYFEDNSVKAIAEMLAEPEGTIKYRLHEARRAIAAALGQTILEDSPLNDGEGAGT